MIPDKATIRKELLAHCEACWQRSPFAPTMSLPFGRTFGTRYGMSVPEWCMYLKANKLDVAVKRACNIRRVNLGLRKLNKAGK